MVGRTLPNGEKAKAPPGVEEIRHRKLVRRAHFFSIIAAWIITVPATALLAAVIYLAFSLLR